MAAVKSELAGLCGISDLYYKMICANSGLYHSLAAVKSELGGFVGIGALNCNFNVGSQVGIIIFCNILNLLGIVVHSKHML